MSAVPKSKQGKQEPSVTEAVVMQRLEALVPKLRDKGVNAMVVLLHEGGIPSDISYINKCTDVTGPGIAAKVNI